MIHNERERLAAKDQLEYLRSELEKRSDSEHTEVTHGVISALRAQIALIEDQLAEYEYLKEGLTKVFKAESLDELGDLVTKARIARGWSQAKLAQILDMEPQQIQRYERNDWQKISLWRLQEIAEALRLRFDIRSHLDEYEPDLGPGALWSGVLHRTPIEAIKDVDLSHSLVYGAVTYTAPTPTAKEGSEDDPMGQPKASTSVRDSGEQLATV